MKKRRRTRVVTTCLLAGWVWIAGWTGCRGTVSTESAMDEAGETIAWLQLDSTIVAVDEVVTGLDQPRDVSLAPDGAIWVSEVTGNLVRTHPRTGEKEVVHTVSDLFHERARGLLSAVLHPDFEDEPYVYLHYTYERAELGSRLVRYRYNGDSLTDPLLIADPLPGGSGHSGSKLMIGPDRKLWLATGDASVGEKAQDQDHLNGKVLRYNLDGSIPSDNPISGSPVWSVGHRNIQGITHDGDRIFASEHGPSNDDEINRIVKSGNYGWPDVHGYCDNEEEQSYCESHSIEEPVHAFTPVVAAAGLAWYDHPSIPEWQHSLLLASLRIQTLRVLPLDPGSETVSDVLIYLQQKLGRIRDVIVGDGGEIYLMTSNTDWYKTIREDIHDPSLTINGDKIIRLRALNESDPTTRPEGVPLWEEDPVALYLGDAEISESASARERLFLESCSACHGETGEGIEGLAPSLTESESVKGSVETLVNLVLHGLQRSSESSYEMGMPGFSTLSSEEIAAITSYVRMELAGLQSGVTADQVDQIRDSGSESSEN